MGLATNAKGEPFAHYTPCQMCEGTGECGKWLSLTDFLEMLKQTHFRHENTSYLGGMHFSADNVWDDIEEVCDDCVVKLDHQILGDFIQDVNSSNPFNLECLPVSGGALFDSQEETITMNANKNNQTNGNKINEKLFGKAPTSWITRYLDPNGFECQVNLRCKAGSELLEKAAILPMITIKPGSR